MAKKMKVTLAGGTYTRQGKVFKAGDKLDVTQDEFERFTGKFNPVGAAPAASSADAAAAVKRAETAEAATAEATKRAEAAEARVAELEAELAAAAEKALKTTPESDGKGKDDKAKGK